MTAAQSQPESWAPGDDLILLVDVGGTSARFSLVRETGETVANSKIFERKYRSDSAKSVCELIQFALRDAEAELDRPMRNQIVICSIAVCGPVVDGRAVLLAPVFGPEGAQTAPMRVSFGVLTVSRGITFRVEGRRTRAPADPGIACRDAQRLSCGRPVASLGEPCGNRHHL